MNYTAWALRIYMAGIFAMGISGKLPAEFYGVGAWQKSVLYWHV